MKSFAPTLLLLVGCFVAPDLIEDDGGSSSDAGAARDGGSGDIGTLVDAGSSDWLIEPPSGTILGASADLDADTSGVQIELTVQGQPTIEFGFTTTTS